LNKSKSASTDKKFHLLQLTRTLASHGAQLKVLGQAALPLLVHNIADRAVSLLVTDTCLTETVKLTTGNSVAVDGKGKTDEEAEEWHEHADVVSPAVVSKTGDGGEESSTTDGCDDEGGSVIYVRDVYEYDKRPARSYQKTYPRLV